MNESLAYFLAGLLAAILKAYFSADQATLSRKSVADVVIGGAVGILYPLYPLFPLPTGANLLQRAAIVLVICYVSTDLLQNILGKAGVSLSGDTMKKSLAWFLIPISLLGLTACSTTSTQKSLHVTAKALEALGDQYIASVPLMQKALDAKLISVSVWNDYAQFSQAFATWYPQTVELWRAAVQANDAVSQDQIARAVSIMGGRLTALTIAAVNAYSKPKTKTYLIPRSLPTAA
jgi:hypothetical protein